MTCNDRFIHAINTARRCKYRFAAKMRLFKGFPMLFGLISYFIQINEKICNMFKKNFVLIGPYLMKFWAWEVSILKTSLSPDREIQFSGMTCCFCKWLVYDVVAQWSRLSVLCARDPGSIPDDTWPYEFFFLYFHHFLKWHYIFFLLSHIYIFINLN